MSDERRLTDEEMREALDEAEVTSSLRVDSRKVQLMARALLQLAAPSDTSEGQENVPGRIDAPFTQEQVVALNEYRRSVWFHPFTCANRDGHPVVDGDKGILIATVRGWLCTFCDYTQGWAHAFMLKPAPSWPAPAPTSEAGGEEARHGVCVDVVNLATKTVAELDRDLVAAQARISELERALARVLSEYGPYMSVRGEQQALAILHPTQDEGSEKR